MREANERMIERLSGGDYTRLHSASELDAREHDRCQKDSNWRAIRLSRTENESPMFVPAENRPTFPVAAASQFSSL